MRKTELGMTLLEVVIAITILMIGVAFIAQSNAVTFKYKNQSTEYKQMLFYAAGQMDAIIERQEAVSESVYSPFDAYTVERFDPVDVEDDDLGTYLERVGVEVSDGDRSVIIYSYRLK